MGQSRYGGPVVDMPQYFEYPPNMLFAAQLDMQLISQYDPYDLLPKTGQLIFFANIRNNIGKVLYTDVANESLTRITREHDDDFFSGKLIDIINTDEESFSERFMPDADNGEKLIWDDFAGSEISKIYGIFTHCQWPQQEIENLTFSDNIVLLQIGENGFNDEGVFSVLISKQDLKQQKFDNCKFTWAQG